MVTSTSQCVCQARNYRAVCRCIELSQEILLAEVSLHLFDSIVEASNGCIPKE